MENSELKQLALLDLSILNFSIMRRRPERGGPLRVDSAPGGARSPSAQRLRRQTHRERVNRSLQFHERSHLFSCAHNDMLSVAMRVHNADCSPSLAHTDRAQNRF